MPNVARQGRLDKPRLSAIWLIYMREMRDQLRDRRTLFTIAVLPILLYPLVGTLLLQIAQFTRQHPTSICIVGTDHLTDTPPLVDGEAFAEGLADDNTRLEVLNYDWNEVGGVQGVKDETSRWVRQGIFDVVVVIPPPFADPSLRIEQMIRLRFDCSTTLPRISPWWPAIESRPS